MAEQGFLFAEMQLQPGDVIDCNRRANSVERRQQRNELYTSGIYRL